MPLCQVIKYKGLCAVTSCHERPEGKASGNVAKYRAMKSQKSFDHNSAAALMVGFGGLLVQLSGSFAKLLPSLGWKVSRTMRTKYRGSGWRLIDLFAQCSRTSYLLVPLHFLQSTHPLQIERLKPFSVRSLVCWQVFVAIRLQPQPSCLADADNHHTSGLALASFILLFREGDANLGHWACGGTWMRGVFDQNLLLIVYIEGF